MRNLWYFGLEPLKERYTEQLSEHWMPSTFEGKDVKFRHIRGLGPAKNEISVGTVLDAYGRGVYAMRQCQGMLAYIAAGSVKENDIIFLQDFWTPGFESVMYMLDLYGIKVKLYSMLHAQSVDEYDFTYPMRNWMRGFELGLDAYHSGIFVGSSIHKEQLKAAGFKSPIHVMGLPVNVDILNSKHFPTPKRNNVIYTSRLDKEKNPYFMMKVAQLFLQENKDWTFEITTSSNDFRSNVPGLIDALKELVENFKGRLILSPNLSKQEYYEKLHESKIQFNSALQDYVSWTLIEATQFGCDIVYPNFRSFPEIIDKAHLYPAFDVIQAVYKLNYKTTIRKYHYLIGDTCDLGRRMEAYIMLNDITTEYNVWHEKELIETLINE